ncbi:MAG: anthranilate phosphoribosyltransferase, partial [Candidatus Promineifilaceae bacterium]
MPLKWAIGRVIAQHDLTYEQAREAMDAIMAGEASPAQIGSYLTALRMKGETVDEIAGSADSMRHHVVAVPIPAAVTGGVLVDTC